MIRNRFALNIRTAVNTSLTNAFRTTGISLSSGRCLLSIMASSLRAQGSNLFLVLLLAVVGKADAREWSEEIRMTHAEEGFQRLYDNHPVILDSHGRINVYGEYNHTDVPPIRGRRNRAVYQVFDLQGQPLRDPLFPSLVAEFPDSASNALAMSIGSEGRIYLLWLTEPDFATYIRHLTILDSTGEVIAANIALEGMDDEANITHVPYMFNDSQGNLIIVSVMDQERFGPWVGYKRFDRDGQPLDTLLHRVIPRGRVYARFCASLDVGDTIHIAHQENFVGEERIRYYKVAPNDEIIENDFWIDSVHAENGIGMYDMDVDRTGRPVFFVIDDDFTHYLVRFTNEMERDLEVSIGRNYSSGRGDLTIDNENNMHLLASFRDERIGEAGSLRYTCIDDSGVTIDTLQLIHNVAMNQGGNRRAEWGQPNLLTIGRDTVLAIWSDGRFGDPIETGSELMIRYSPPLNNIIESPEISIPTSFTINSVYPNPFNGWTSITLSNPYQNPLKIIIVDITGQQVFEALLNTKSLYPQFVWRGCNQIGIPIAGGSYILTVTDHRALQSRIITIVR